MYGVNIMQSAKDEIHGIYCYIATELDNPTAADRHVSLIQRKISALQENPESYPLVRDKYLAEKGIRYIVVQNYLVFFIVREEEKSVSVMRVLYGRRDWRSLLDD